MNGLILIPTFATICMLAGFDETNEQPEIHVEKGELSSDDFFKNGMKE